MNPNYQQPRSGGHQKQHRRDDPKTGSTPQNVLPVECVIKESFYKDKESKCLKEDIFLNAAKEASNTFAGGKKGMTQSSLRAMFNMLKALDNRIKVEKNFPVDKIREEYLKFHRWCIYQEKRDVIPSTFLDFAEEHLHVATRDKDEFHGFVEYLTSIMARMKTK